MDNGLDERNRAVTCGGRRAIKGRPPPRGMRSHAVGRCQLVAADVSEQVPYVTDSRSGSTRVDALAAFWLPRCRRLAYKFWAPGLEESACVSDVGC